MYNKSIHNKIFQRHGKSQHKIKISINDKATRTTQLSLRTYFVQCTVYCVTNTRKSKSINKIRLLK